VFVPHRGHRRGRGPVLAGVLAPPLISSTPSGCSSGSWAGPAEDPQPRRRRSVDLADHGRLHPASAGPDPRRRLAPALTVARARRHIRAAAGCPPPGRLPRTRDLRPPSNDLHKSGRSAARGLLTLAWECPLWGGTGIWIRAPDRGATARPVLQTKGRGARTRTPDNRAGRHC
jgi:hypothetical protein